jgi:hypothetical protein
VRCASAGAERPEGGLRADPAYVAIPRKKKKTPNDPDYSRAGVRIACTSTRGILHTLNRAEGLNGHRTDQITGLEFRAKKAERNGCGAV